MPFECVGLVVAFVVAVVPADTDVLLFGIGLEKISIVEGDDGIGDGGFAVVDGGVVVVVKSLSFGEAEKGGGFFADKLLGIFIKLQFIFEGIITDFFLSGGVKSGAESEVELAVDVGNGVIESKPSRIAEEYLELQNIITSGEIFLTEIEAVIRTLQVFSLEPFVDVAVGDFENRHWP